MAQQLFDLAAQFFVACASLLQKGGASKRLAFQRGVVKRFDLAPALLVEHHFFTPAVQFRITLTGLASPTIVAIMKRCPSAATS